MTDKQGKPRCAGLKRIIPDVVWAQIALFYTDDAHAPDLTEYFKNDGPLPDVSARSGYDEIMAIVPKLVPKQKWSHSPYKGCKELNKLPHLGGSP